MMIAKPRTAFDPIAAKPPPAFPGMRIGLMGGSFNPAHNGHLHISLEALRRGGLDQLWWIVSPGNPLKSSAGLPNLPSRMTDARRIAMQHPQIKVTGFEAGLPTPYAVSTVRFLQRRYPATSFVWIAGGDILAELHRWRAWRRLFHMLPMMFLDRPGQRHRAMASPAAKCFAAFRAGEECAGRLASMPAPVWTYLTLPLSDLSSTAIRQRNLAV